MTVRWRRAARLLTRVAAALVVLLLVASLALRLWARHRYQDASRAFVADFGERVEEPTLDRPQGGTWLRAAALIVQLSPEEMGTIHSWVRTTEPLTAEEARWARALLERERLPRELLERAARSERIDLFLGPPERLEVERMAGLTKPNELGALVKLLVAEELERRAHGDFSGACESLEQLGSLARGIRKGRFFFEQMLASLPESTLLHRLHAALSAGAPFPASTRSGRSSKASIRSTPPAVRSSRRHGSSSYRTASESFLGSHGRRVTPPLDGLLRAGQQPRPSLRARRRARPPYRARHNDAADRRSSTARRSRPRGLAA